MKIKDVLETYDASYAAEYDETHLFGTWNRESIAFQLSLLEERLRRGGNWLDVACGTGWVLSRFPQVHRAGLDISGPMLEAARAHNPGVRFVERNYREPFPEWNDQWDLVSCMWWAYCLAETMSEIRTLVARLADWTSPQGEVYVPLCSIQKFDRHNIRIPYIDPKVPGRLMITGITWTWIQENGKRHDNALSPQVDYLAAMFYEHFETVEVIEGPLDIIGEGWRVQDVLLARGKRAVREPGDLHAQFRTTPPGRDEWLLSTTDKSLAHLVYLSPDLTHVRIEIESLADDLPTAVQVGRRGFRIVQGSEYRITFRAKADRVRSIGIGAGLAREPWSSVGLNETVVLTPDWNTFSLGFTATASTDLGRLHFDLGEGLVPVDLADVEVSSVGF